LPFDLFYKVFPNLSSPKLQLLSYEGPSRRGRALAAPSLSSFI
jgi:hypothetical protein